MYPVRETVTGMPLICAGVSRKYLSFDRSCWAASCRISRELGPCSESAAVFSETSSIDAEARGVEVQPAQGRVRRSHAIRLFVQDGDGAVIDLFAVVVAPRRVQHLADFRLADVAGDHVVEQAPRVRPGDQVLV